METLENLRKDIDDINSELVKLLNKRATIVKKIGNIKQASGLKTFTDKNRETEVIRKITAENNGPFTNEDLAVIFEAIISTSTHLQEKMPLTVTPKKSR